MQMIDVQKITELQQKNTERWHECQPVLQENDFYNFVEKNHLHNFELWHEEDKARRDDLGSDYVYQAKRNIDRANQLRNNMMEAMDQWVQQHYPTNPASPCHSETPGMMIDRLSILTLKSYHMAEQLSRTDVNAEHLQTCQQKLTTIEAQRQQLTICLDDLLQQLISGTRHFRVYHQFKMYNDPHLNPQLYKHREQV